MLREFAGFDKTVLSDREVEKAIVAEQSLRMRERAPGKYGPMLFVIKLVPDMEVLYHFGRKVDDMVDGDAPLPLGIDNPHELLDHLDSVARGYVRPEKDFSIDFLLQRSIMRLEKRTKGKEDIQELVSKFLYGERVEYESRIQRKAFTHKELEGLYKVAFEPAQDISLIALGAGMRSRQIPELAQIQGRSYSVSDLKPDLSNGLIRIPSEIIEESGTSIGELMECPDCVDGNEIINEWKLSEKAACSRLKSELFEREMDVRTKLYCRFLTIKA